MNSKLIELLIQRGKLYIQKQREYVYVYIRINGLLPNEAATLERRCGGSRWSSCFYYSWSSCNVKTLSRVVDGLSGYLDERLYRKLCDYCAAQRGAERSKAATEIAAYLQSGSANLKEHMK